MQQGTPRLRCLIFQLHGLQFENSRRMSNKFKIEYYHKIPQTTSPYLQLLEAKKKIFGYKYEIIRNDKNTSQVHNKSVSQTQYTQPSHKHSKTQSHQKQKPKSQKQNSKKKRSHTEQGDDRLHESLFLNRDVQAPPSKEGKHQATKSLFNAEGLHEQSINPQQFMKNCRNLLSNEDKALKSMTQQVDSKGFSRQKPANHSINSLDRLQINEIDDLINLIDTCIEQSNDYINYLTEKLQNMKNDMQAIKQEQANVIKMKDGIINEKEHEIDHLKKELYSFQYGKTEQPKTFQIKKLLEIIDKITQQNTVLKSRLQESNIDTKFYKQNFQKEKKDIYHEIHNKIDILNISIDKKSQDHGEQDFLKDSKKNKFNKPKFYK